MKAQHKRELQIKSNPRAGGKTRKSEEIVQAVRNHDKKSRWGRVKRDCNYLQEKNEGITSNEVARARDLGGKIGDDIHKWALIPSC